MANRDDLEFHNWNCANPLWIPRKLRKNQAISGLIICNALKSGRIGDLTVQAGELKTLASPITQGKESRPGAKKVSITRELIQATNVICRRKSESEQATSIEMVGACFLLLPKSPAPFSLPGFGAGPRVAGSSSRQVALNVVPNTGLRGELRLHQRRDHPEPGLNHIQMKPFAISNQDTQAQIKVVTWCELS
jgi:hypothetical protein